MTNARSILFDTDKIIKIMSRFLNGNSKSKIPFVFAIRDISVLILKNEIYFYNFIKNEDLDELCQRYENSSKNYAPQGFFGKVVATVAEDSDKRFLWYYADDKSILYITGNTLKTQLPTFGITQLLFLRIILEIFGSD